ncbi:MAG TPA: UpxY family transcription antiterminator [Flavisolibacter sp.]|nr:UpxY family transcription antiterminator [Flavisolibacter sp.]
MEINKSLTWYAVYTRSKWEKKVAEQLTRRRIENYCPLNKVVRQWSDRKKIIMEPLFSSYVFVRAQKEELIAIQRIDGVINLVYWLGKPAIIKDVEIDTIKDFLSGYKNVKLKRVQVNVRDMVRIVGGPLSDYEGEVVAVQSKVIKVILPTLGYMMTAEVPANNIQVINPKQSITRETNSYRYSF